MNTQSDLVSVVIPTYNRLAFIGETLDSVLSQTYRNLEAIVVDDGSTDGTGAFIQTHYAQDSRVRYIWQKNAERAVARNTGIKAACGDFIAFLDSDDLWLPAKLERQMLSFAAEPHLVMVHTGWSQLYENGMTTPMMLTDETLYQGDIFAPMVYRNLIASPTPLMRRRVFDRVGGFNEDRQLICFEDWEMWTRIASLGRVGYIPETLAMHRIHCGNTEKLLTSTVYRRFVRAILQVPDSPRRAVAIEFARRRFWSQIQESVQRHDGAAARAYFRNGLACLGLRMLSGANPSRRTKLNLMLGRRIAKALLPLWKLRHSQQQT